MGHRGRNKMTAKESRFIDEYLVDLNQTRAAQRAGYKNPAKMSYDLMKRPHIAKAIGLRKGDQIERLELKADVVLKELYYMATRTADDFKDPETGEWTTDLKKLSERAKHCIEGYEVEESFDKDGERRVKTKVRLCNKVSSIDMAMKHFGAYAKDNAQKQTETKINIDFSKLLEDRRDAPDEVEQRIIDVEPTQSPKRIVEQPKYGLKELIDGEGMEEDS